MDYEKSIATAYENATAEQRARGEAWYRDYGRRVRTEARRASVPVGAAMALVGVSSINTRPEPGLRWAIRTMAGETGGHLPLVVARGAAIMAARALPFDALRDIACAPTSPSRKVRSFACNVRTGGAVCRHAEPCVTIDRWAHYVATNGTRKDVPSGPQYERIATAYRNVAARLGIAPAILQAIVWVTVAE